MVRNSTVCALAVACLMTMGASPAASQATLDLRHSSNWFVGYAANAPQQLVGFGSAAIFQRLGGFGFYLDGKFAIDTPAGDRTFLRDRTVEQALDAGHIFHRDDSAWRSLNLALVRGLTEELAVYAGGGVSWETVYSQYLDEDAEFGEDQAYWIEDGDLSTVHGNLMAGVFFRLSNRIIFQFGAEAAPAGVTAGMHIRLR